MESRQEDIRIAAAEIGPFIEQAVANIDRKKGTRLPRTSDIRPRIFDKISGSKILIDSGAMCSVWPKAWRPTAVKDTTCALRAVNGSQISTYGKDQVSIQLGRKKYTHTVIIADIQEPIIGWDWMRAKRLSLVWAADGNLNLMDYRASITVPTTIATESTVAGLALVDIDDDASPDIYTGHLCATEYFDGKSFMEWAQEKSAEIPDDDYEIQPPYSDLLAKYPDLLKPNFHAKTTKHNIVHNINTGDAKPCKAKPRPLLQNSPKAIQGRKEWQLLEDIGIIKPVDPSVVNEWTTPLHLAPKADGTLRPVGDFRQLNSKTILDGFPLPNIKNFVADIKGSTIFSKIDLVKAFHHIALDESSQRKTTTVTPWGAWQYVRLPMGLRNAAQSFQRFMDHVTKGIQNIFVYLDDILVYSKDMSEHIKTLELLFQRLSDNGLTISKKKCRFGLEAMDFVGYRVRSTGITPLPKKVEAIRSFPQPTTQKHLLGFLGGIGYYRRNLPDLNGESPASVLQPLYTAATVKLPPGQSFRTYWSDNKLVEHFTKAKELLANAAELAHPDPSAPLSLTTDASDRAVGGVLQQFVDGKWEPLGYWSKHLNEAQRKWSVFRRELHGIQQAMRNFLPEFEGRHLVIYTDHKAIVDAFKQQNPQPHDPVAFTAISEIAFWTSDVRFVAGKSNVVADLLSRPPDVPMGTAYTITSEIAAATMEPLRVVHPQNIADAQQNCKDVLNHRSGRCPRDVAIKTIRIDGVPIYCEVALEEKPRPLVPKILQKFENIYS